MVTSVIARAVRIRGGLTHACIDEVEVGSPLSVVLDLPAAVDPVAVVAEAADEALVEGLALARERPLAVADGHLVDPADAAVVGVELEVGAAGRVATDHARTVRSLGHLDRETLDHELAAFHPLERRRRLARPGRPARRRRLQCPLSEEGLELLQCILGCGLNGRLNLLGGVSTMTPERAKGHRPSRYEGSSSTRGLTMCGGSSPRRTCATDCAARVSSSAMAGSE